MNTLNLNIPLGLFTALLCTAAMLGMACNTGPNFDRKLFLNKKEETQYFFEGDKVSFGTRAPFALCEAYIPGLGSMLFKKTDDSHYDGTVHVTLSNSVFRFFLQPDMDSTTWFGINGMIYLDASGTEVAPPLPVAQELVEDPPTPQEKSDNFYRRALSGDALPPGTLASSKQIQRFLSELEDQVDTIDAVIRVDGEKVRGREAFRLIQESIRENKGGEFAISLKRPLWSPKPTSELLEIAEVPYERNENTIVLLWDSAEWAPGTNWRSRSTAITYLKNTYSRAGREVLAVESDGQFLVNAESQDRWQFDP